MEKYLLNQNFALREEFFGCLCFNPIEEQFFQFNKDAFNVLRHLRTPLTTDELIAKLRLENAFIERELLVACLDDWIRKKIITTNSHLSNKNFLFTEFSNREKIPENYLIAPTGCTIYVTEFCSKSCLHCIVRSSPHVDKTSDFTVKEWQPIFERLRSWGVISLIFTGGEPLLKKDIFEILKCADLLGFDICLLSDFDGINQNIIDRLKTIRNLNYLQVSLDGSSEETHDFLRGKGSFKKAIGRIKLYLENRIDITVSSVIHKGNISEVLKIGELCRELGVKYLYLNPLAPYGRAKERLFSLVLNDNELRDLGYLYYYVIRVIGVSSGNAFWQNLTPEEVLETEFFPFKNVTDVMSTAIFQMSINSKGDCYLDSKMKSENLLKLGNALTDDFKTMWNSEKLAPLRKTYTPGGPAFIRHSDLLKLITN